MGRGKPVTPRKRAIVQQYVYDGLTATEIAAKLGIPRRTIADIVNRWKLLGSVQAGKSTG